jgi:hypothetical protein
MDQIEIFISIVYFILGTLLFLNPPKYGNKYFGKDPKPSERGRKMFDAAMKYYAYGLLTISIFFMLMGTFKARNVSLFLTFALSFGLTIMMIEVVMKIVKRKFPKEKVEG